MNSFWFVQMFQMAGSTTLMKKKHMSGDQNPGYFLYIRDYTTQLCKD